MINNKFTLTAAFILGVAAFFPVLLPQAQGAGFKMIMDYKAPLRAKPARRFAAGARGSCRSISDKSEGFGLYVLAPQSTGQTLNTRPTLFWAVSKPISGKFVFTLGQTLPPDTFDFIEPLLETTLEFSAKAGIHAFSLADHGISLKNNVEYEWSLSLLCDSKNRSLDLIAAGLIMRVESAAGLDAKVKDAGKKELPYLYAGNSLWYDAVETLMELIQQYPGDKMLADARAALLTQGGLPEIAGYDIADF
ncbi:MAG: DUF928 domain-containing protein [Gammaproteobacteria bacterium]|nr:DUF928 domain-containing protein [Gammaproteobacteria bacterium]